MRLSVREKILLYLLIILAIVLLGLKYLLFPLVQSYKGHSSQLSNLVVSQNIAEQEIAGAKNTDSTLQQEKSKAVSAAASLLPEPQNYLLNVWLVNLAEKNSLSVSSVRFSAPSAADISAASPAGNGSATSASAAGGINDYLMRKYIQSYNTGVATAPTSNPSSSAASGAGSAPATGALCKISVSLTMTAPSLSQVEAFFDTIKNSGKTAVITAVDCSVRTDNTCGVTATIDCYGTIKPDSSDTTFNW